MKVSYNWLKTHFDSNLPAVEDIAGSLISHSFEVEDIEKSDNSDSVFEVKILPDRAHDCLCHIGISREISAQFGLSAPKSSVSELDNKSVDSTGPGVTIEDSHLCRRYVGRVVRNIDFKESPEKIKNLLINIGQKSINNIVDAANFVMFEMGQPLHAFDLDKISGDIVVRKAKKGEKIQTLDDKDIDLDEEVLVIADNDGPLAIAGVKGGKRAGVTPETKNIFLESASFDPVSVRRASTRLNLRTDASKRFENDYPQILALDAMRLFSGLLLEVAGNDNTVFEDIIDEYPTKVESVSTNFTPAEINSILGSDISADEMISILAKTGIEASVNGETITAVSPKWRLDLSIVPDYAEEIGRIYGYDKIPNKLPGEFTPDTKNKEYDVVNKIKQILLENSFSEVYGYSLTNKGEVELDNPLASDKSFMRANLTDLLKEKIELNLRNTLFDQDAVMIFEIGNIFRSDSEGKNVCIGIGYKTKKLNKSKTQIEEILKNIFEGLGIEEIPPYNILEEETFSIVEIPLREIVNKSTKVDFDADKLVNKEASYKKVSQYPKSTRDIALFVPPSVSPEEIVQKIKENTGDLLIMEPILFDVFEKKNEEGNVVKKSYAFRLVFQSYEKTLQDEDVNLDMDKVTRALSVEEGWEIR